MQYESEYSKRSTYFQSFISQIIVVPYTVTFLDLPTSTSIDFTSSKYVSNQLRRSFQEEGYIYRNDINYEGKKNLSKEKDKKIQVMAMLNSQNWNRKYSEYSFQIDSILPICQQYIYSIILEVQVGNSSLSKIFHNEPHKCSFEIESIKHLQRYREGLIWINRNLCILCIFGYWKIFFSSIAF